MDIPSLTTSSLGVHVTLPPADLFKFPPASLPKVLTPPISDYTLARPFNIDPEIYNTLLDISFPLTVALVYATTVTILNRVNKNREYKPWGISKSPIFFALVILHNVFLAVYSAWTFIGMANTIVRAWPSWEEEHGLVGVVDALCKINGPRGLGSAATFNSTNNSWGITDQQYKLAGDLPDSTDVGRIWNEGLAFYGWLFYLSKFYEVFDTFIILAKGKKSNILQTYHHAGAMLCMWAGIRYMAPPIWLFVFINSGLHSLMYTYYTLSALSIKVPLGFKKILTTLQIAQLLIGASYAAAHLFIAYNVPVNTPYLFTHNLSTALPTITSSVSSAFASATATVGVGNWLKKIALRAAGEEGLAENVHNNRGEPFGLDAVKAAEVEKAREEIRYKLEYPTVSCIDTSGQAFAVYLNVLYLAPLTYLFVKFFIRSYTKRTSSSSTAPEHEHTIEKSTQDAIKDLKREIQEAMSNTQGDDDVEIPPQVKAKLEKVQHATSDVVANLEKEAEKLSKMAKSKASDMKSKADEVAKDAKQKGADAIEKAKRDSAEAIRSGRAKAGELVEQGKAKAGNAAEAGKDKGNEVAQNGKRKGEDAAEKAKEKNNDVAEQGKEKSGEAAQKGKENVKNAEAKTENFASETKDEAQKEAKDVKGKSEDAAKQGKEKTEDAAKKGKEKSEDAAKQGKRKGEEAAKDGKDSTKSAEGRKGNGERKPTEESAESKDDKPENSLDESAYEVSIDEITSKEEKEAENKMQPNGS